MGGIAGGHRDEVTRVRSDRWCHSATPSNPTPNNGKDSGAGTEAPTLVSKFKMPVCPCVSGMVSEARPVIIAPEAFRGTLLCSKLAPSEMPPVKLRLVNCMLAEVSENHSPDIGP